MEKMYDQLTQYSKGDLLADIRIAGPMRSMETYRKPHAFGRKKTSEKVDRARNRVTRPESAETLDGMEDKYPKWRKYIAYLKDIDAYDFVEAGMVSISLDLIPDDAHKEITAKCETTGKKTACLKQIMLEVEKIIGKETKPRGPQARSDQEQKPTTQERATTTRSRICTCGTRSTAGSS